MRDLNTSHDPKIFRRRLRGLLLVTLAVMCLVHSVSALDPTKAFRQYIYDRWGAERGFVGGTIYAICQSEDGYLWIGTDQGLVRFDGFGFTLVERPMSGLPATGPVRGLVPDKQGNMWIRLDGPRLLVYRDGRFADAFATFGLDEEVITALSPDNHGGIVLSGIGSRSFRFRNGKFETIADAQDAPGTVLSMAETLDGTVWMGTRDDGLFRISRGKIYKEPGGLIDAKINVLLATDDGGLWIGTDSGLFFRNASGLVKPILPSIKQLQILALSRDREGNLWVGAEHGIIRISHAGVVSLDRVDQESGDTVTAVSEDSDGDIWFGGSRGVERLRDGTFTTYSTAEGLPSENNGPIYVDAEGRTWFAPLTGGLYWLKDGRVGNVSIAGLSHDVIYSISGGTGEIWIGRQTGGLTVLSDSGDSFTAHTYIQEDGLAQDNVYSVHRNHDGTVWAGTVSGGISKLKDGKFTNYSIADGLISNSVNSIVEGSDGKMWFATPNGLECYTDGHWTNRSARDGLPSSEVRTIFEDSKHVLWIATAGGLAFLAAGQLQVPRNLPDYLREQIFGIAEADRGFLWIATSAHVLQVNREQLVAGALDEAAVRDYGLADGLQGVEAIGRDRSIVTDSLSRIWLSLNRGLAVGDPKLGIRNAVPVEARIESISAGGSPINIQGMPTIAAGKQSITFNFIGSSLAVPDEVRFRYKLDGSDQAWSTATSLRQVVYTHLTPGLYQFRVVASRGDGLWNGPETTFPFVIEPAIWQTWWFRISCLLACVFAIIALHRFRMHQLKHQMSALFQERLTERTRIARELHDTLLQGILSASMQLDVAEDQLPDSSPTKPMLKRILELMGKVTEEGRTTLHGLRTGENDNRKLELAFSRIGQEFAIDEKIDFRVTAHSATRILRPMIRDEVYRIGREALVNAFLHSRASTVEVEVEYAGRYLRVLVRDDGCGIDPGVLQVGRERHWGLAGMRERSERIGASLKLRSRVGAGTEVELTIPGTLAFENTSDGSIARWLPWLRREEFTPVASGSKDSETDERLNSDPDLQRRRSSPDAGRNRGDHPE